MTQRKGPADVFAGLWERVQNDGVGVLYAAPLGCAEIDAEGLYAPPGTRAVRTEPQILLFSVPPAPMPSPQSEPADGQPIHDACTLTHEYGHWLSDKEGHRTSVYLEAIRTPHDQWPTIPPESRQIVYSEEARAWRLGRAVLAELGCGERAAYDERESTSLETYRRCLHLASRPCRRAFV